MKYLVVLADGMADEPIAELGHRTPLQYARTPYMDRLAASGVTGRLRTVPDGFEPGSEVANLSVLGYSLPAVYEGRGALEAAGMGIRLQPDELAMRCNLLCVQEERLKSYSTGDLADEETEQLITFLNDELGDENIRFYRGLSYRHLLVIKKGDKRIDCTPPHNILSLPFRPALVRAQTPEAGSTAVLLNKLIWKSQDILPDHPVNRRRINEEKEPANSIWPWSPGYRPVMQTFKQLYGIGKSAVISAVDVIRGIGAYAGMDVISVEGATGKHDTNYEGKAQAAIRALQTHDFVYLHIEASDEAGHAGDAALKVRTIEDLDSRIIKPLFEALSQWDVPVTVAVLPDHPTPCALRTHTDTPVPFLIYRPGITPDRVTRYDEFSVQPGKYPLLNGNEFMKEVLK